MISSEGLAEPKPRRRALSDIEKGQIIALKTENKTNVYIGNLIGRDEIVVRRFWTKYTTTGQTATLPRSGRPRITSDIQDIRLVNHLLLCAKKGAEVNIESIKRDSGLEHVSDSTITRRLNESEEVYFAQALGK